MSGAVAYLGLEVLKSAGVPARALMVRDNTGRELGRVTNLELEGEGVLVSRLELAELGDVAALEGTLSIAASLEEAGDRSELARLLGVEELEA